MGGVPFTHEVLAGVPPSFIWSVFSTSDAKIGELPSKRHPYLCTVCFGDLMNELEASQFMVGHLELATSSLGHARVSLRFPSVHWNPLPGPIVLAAFRSPQEPAGLLPLSARTRRQREGGFPDGANWCNSCQFFAWWLSVLSLLDKKYIFPRGLKQMEDSAGFNMCTSRFSCREAKYRVNWFAFSWDFPQRCRGRTPV